MGISSPDVGYIGYAPSNTTLCKVATERSTGSTSWALLYRGVWVSDVTFDSIIRVKADMRVTVGAVVGEMLWKVNGISVWYDATTNNVYESKTDDIDVTWRRNALIEVFGEVISGAATLKLKNIEIAGTLSPGVMWVA